MAILMTSCAKTGKIEYPAAPSDSTRYEVFGMTVADPYRPLENDTAAATLAWVEAENKVTQDYLSQIPFRENLRKRLSTLNRYKKEGLPSLENDGKYYFFANDGSKNQSILYRMDSIGAEPEVFIDPNELSDDGTVALTGVYQSHDGRHTAYSISRSGSDWTEIYVLDTATGKLLPDHIEWAKFTGAAWHGDGFYYSAYPRPEAGKEYSVANEYHKVYYHKLGTPQSEDKVVFENPEQPLHFHSADVSDDESTIWVTASGQGHGNTLAFKSLDKPGKWTSLADSQDYTAAPIGVVDGKMYMFTSIDAPRNRLVCIDLARPGRENWVDIVPEDAEGGVLTNVLFSGKDKLIAVFDRDASNHAYIFPLEGGKAIREVEFPTYGTSSFSAGRSTDRVFYSFSSFVYPSAIYSYDPATGESTLYKSTEIEGFNPDDYVTEQVFYTSADGTRVPMFTVRHKDVRPLRLRTLQRDPQPRLQPQPPAMARKRRHIRPGQPARRRRIRRELAPGRHEDAETQRVQRLHRCRRVYD